MPYSIAHYVLIRKRKEMLDIMSYMNAFFSHSSPIHTQHTAYKLGLSVNLNCKEKYSVEMKHSQVTVWEIRSPRSHRQCQMGFDSAIKSVVSTLTRFNQFKRCMRSIFSHFLAQELMALAKWIWGRRKCRKRTNCMKLKEKFLQNYVLPST
jgi:hypothetical protein